MKALKVNNVLKKIPVSIFAILIIFSSGSCAKKTASLSQSMIPESNGNVQIKRDVNSNYVIHIDLSDLENVKNLSPAKEAYVVWMVSDQKLTKNIGQIEGANSWPSKRSKASFEATSATKPTKIYITAENDVNIQKPGKQIVWSTSSF